MIRARVMCVCMLCMYDVYAFFVRDMYVLIRTCVVYLVCCVMRVLYVMDICDVCMLRMRVLCDA